MDSDGFGYNLCRLVASFTNITKNNNSYSLIFIENQNIVVKEKKTTKVQSVFTVILLIKKELTKVQLLLLRILNSWS